MNNDRTLRSYILYIPSGDSLLETKPDCEGDKPS